MDEQGFGDFLCGVSRIALGCGIGRRWEVRFTGGVGWVAADSFLVGAPPPRPRRIGAESELADGGISPRAQCGAESLRVIPPWRALRAGGARMGVFAGKLRSIPSWIYRLSASRIALGSGIGRRWEVRFAGGVGWIAADSFLVGAPPPRPRRIGAESELADEEISPRAQCGAESLRVIPPWRAFARGGPGGKRFRQKTPFDIERDTRDGLVGFAGRSGKDLQDPAAPSFDVLENIRRRSLRRST